MTDVVAAADGTIRDVGSNGFYGSYVLLVHTNDGSSTLYGFLDTVSVATGDELAVGDTIGSVSDRLHLEYIASVGESSLGRVDPEPCIVDLSTMASVATATVGIGG